MSLLKISEKTSIRLSEGPGRPRRQDDRETPPNAEGDIGLRITGESGVHAVRVTKFYIYLNDIADGILFAADTDATGVFISITMILGVQQFLRLLNSNSTKTWPPQGFPGLVTVIPVIA